jgi:hypothetical protein
MRESSQIPRIVSTVTLFLGSRLTGASALGPLIGSQAALRPVTSLKRTSKTIAPRVATRMDHKKTPVAPTPRKRSRTDSIRHGFVTS